MPVYGYRCSRGHHFEVTQRITEAPLTQCPECGAPVTRVFYPVGIVFKGSGFYTTDSKKPPGGDVKGSKESESKPENKSEKKPEEKKPESKEKKQGEKEPKK